MRPIKDITGQRFGKLTAIERTDKKRGSSYIWRCKCDCGNEIDVVLTNLTLGRTTSCGCTRSRDIAGQKFGRLTAIEQTAEKTSDGAYYWKCLCDCGNEVLVPITRLKSGLTKSCGCIRAEGIDLTGRRYGGLVVLERAGYDPDGKPLWRCHCDCGNDVVFPASQLTTLRVRSCGCRNKGSIHYSREGHITDLTGQKFGMLTVLERLEEKNNGSYLWRCLCECGTQVNVTASYLKKSNNPSCGCAWRKSRGTFVKNWDKTEAQLLKNKR